MNFAQFLSEKINLSQSEIELLMNNCSTHNFQKKEIILEPFSLSKKIYFVEEGIIRVFYETDARDITLAFCEENEISLPVESVFYDKECKFGIQSVTETKIIKLNYAVWEQLCEQNPRLLQLDKKFLIENIRKFTEHIYSTHFKTPKERFDDLMQSKPAIFNKVPLNTIASYLGMTQETLSRLRAGK